MKRTIVFFLTIAAVVAVFYFIKQPMPFTPIVGKSMQPELKMGDLITYEEVAPSEVEVGDIIIYSIPPLTQKYYKCPPVITHRVAEINESTTGLTFRTKGDNNSGQDPWIVRPQDIMGKVDQQIPYLGFPILFLQSSSGQIFVLIVVFVLALYLYADNLTQGGRKLQRGLLAPVVEEIQSSNQVVAWSLEELASAVEVYGQHLKSHTSAIMGLSAASQELMKGAEELRRNVTAQGKILGELTKLVEQMSSGMKANG